MTAPQSTRVGRVDGREKVTGQATYTADHTAAGLAHGYLVLSSVGGGELLSMDTAAAERAPGVLAVYSPFNPLKLQSIKTTPDLSFAGQFWLPLQDTQIRYYGQIIGLVVAETYEEARHAASLVTATYAEQPPKTSVQDGIERAIAPPIPVNYEEPELNLLAEDVTTVDEALQASEVRVSASYSQPVDLPTAIEPHAVLASWEGGVLTLRLGTQSAVGSAMTTAEALGVDVFQVRVISPLVGGAFGGKMYLFGHPLLTAVAARELNRPIKTVLTQEQVFTVTGHRSGVVQRVELGADREGVLNAVKHDAWSGFSASGVLFESAAHTTSRVLYKSPNIHVGQRIVPLDLPPTTWVRAPGEQPGSFALESAMDELAAELGIDPIELRMRNYADTLPGREVPWSSKHLDECYRVGAERFGWADRAERPGVTTDGDWLVGQGMASSVYPGNLLPTTVAVVTLRPDGGATVASATADPGTGMLTVLAMVCAQELGIPLERVTPLLGDSVLPLNFGAFGSMGTASTASAVAQAAAVARAELIRLAVSDERSPFHGLDPEQVGYAEGRLTAPGGREASFGELLTRLESVGVDGTGTSAPGAEKLRYAIHSFGAHFCEVRVHRWTREVRVSRWTSVIDAGRIINEVTARGQIVGGVLFGLGQALLEDARPEAGTGRFANANLADYLLPVHADTPDFDVHFLPYPDTDFNQLGARGIGEIGTVGSAAAIANAVYHATGIRVRDLPITVDKLL